MADEQEIEDDMLDLVGRAHAGPSKRSRARRAPGTDSDDDLLGLGSGDDDDNDDDDDDADFSDGGRGGKRPAAKQRKGEAGKKHRGGGRKATAPSDDEPDLDDDDDDGFGPDLYIDDEDRARLEAMNELEREMILAERAEKRDEARLRRQLLQKAKSTEDTAKPAGRRKPSKPAKPPKGKAKVTKRRGPVDYSALASGSEEEEEEEELAMSDEDTGEGSSDGEGRAPARRPPTRRSAAAAAAKEPGPQAGAAVGAVLEEDLAGLAGVRKESYLDEDEMDLGRGEGAGDDVGADDEEAADPADLRSIQLTRSQLEAMVDKPFFEGDGLTGALIRMAYGPPSKDADGNSVPTYWLMQIVSIKESHSTYPFGPKGAPCRKKLELRDGARVVRTLPMTTVSNSALEDAEIERFGRHLARVGDRPISKHRVAEIRQRITAAINYRWDAAQVKERLARKRDAGMLPVNAAAEKLRLKTLLEAANAKGAARDLDEIAKLESQLEALERRVTAKAAEGKGRTADMSSINQRNKEANFNQTVRNVATRPASGAERKGGGDPFSRRVTRPNIYWNTAAGGGKTGAAEQPGPDSPAIRNATPPPAALGAGPQLVGKDGQLTSRAKRLSPVALLKALDLPLDLGKLQDCSVVPPLHLRLLGPRWVQGLRHHMAADLTGKTVLSLAEWQARAAAPEG